MTDDEVGAMRAYRWARRAAMKANDIDALVNTLTFGADAWRSRGPLREALEMLDSVFEDAELYTSAYARAWARYYRGMVRMGMGDLAGARDDLDRGIQTAVAAGNAQAVAWLELGRANVLRSSDLTAAREAQQRCQRAIADFGRPRFQCAVRLGSAPNWPAYIETPRPSTTGSPRCERCSPRGPTSRCPTCMRMSPPWRVSWTRRRPATRRAGALPGRALGTRRGPHPRRAMA